MELLTADMITVMAVIAAAVFLFVVEWVRVDVVALIIMIILPILHVVTVQDAFSGLSSNAVVSIIAVIILGAGLDRTGVMNKVVAPLTKLAGPHENRLMALFSATVAIISSFMQNIGAVALFLPAVRRACTSLNLSPSRILMPLGFLGIIGGCLTLVGSSPLILLNDLLKPLNLAPFGMFDVTPIGLALVVAALLYFIFLGRLVLPATGKQGNPTDTQTPALPGLDSKVYELVLPRNFNRYSSLEELNVRPKYQVTVVAIARAKNNEKIFAPTRSILLENQDSIAVLGSLENVNRLAKDYRCVIQPKLTVFEQDLSPNNAGIVEAVIPPNSDLVGITMRSIYFRKKFQVSPLAVARQDTVFYSGLSDLVLAPGDFLILHGRWERFAILKESTKSFFFITTFISEVLRTNKAAMAVGCFAVALALVISGLTPLSIALMVGAIGMIITGVLSADEAYESVDWRTVFLLAGLIPLGMAAEKTGTAAYIAHTLLAAMGTPSPLLLITVIGVLTSIFTLVISNVGATVLMVPLAVNMALTAGADPRIAALTVAIAASNTFILPTHQVNAFVMGPGGYRTKDFLRAGGLMTIIYLVVMIASIALVFGVSATK